MYILDLIPRNSTELAEAILIEPKHDSKLKLYWRQQTPLY